MDRQDGSAVLFMRCLTIAAVYCLLGCPGLAAHAADNAITMRSLAEESPFAGKLVEQKALSPAVQQGTTPAPATTPEPAVPPKPPAPSPPPGPGVPKTAPSRYPGCACPDAAPGDTVTYVRPSRRRPRPRVQPARRRSRRGPAAGRGMISLNFDDADVYFRGPGRSSARY